MTRLDEIIEHGNRPPLSVEGVRSYPHSTDNWITCADGFKVSVIAGDGSYCTPRPSALAILGEVPSGYPGPYTAVELGYPSERPEPWSAWEQHAEDSTAPTETVYSYVPVALVRDLLALHGGEAS